MENPKVPMPAILDRNGQPMGVRKKVELRVRRTDRSIVMEFREPVQNMEMNPESAMRLAKLLAKTAKKMIRKSPIIPVSGRN